MAYYSSQNDKGKKKNGRESKKNGDSHISGEKGFFTCICKQYIFMKWTGMQSIAWWRGMRIALSVHCTAFVCMPQSALHMHSRCAHISVTVCTHHCNGTNIWMENQCIVIGGVVSIALLRGLLIYRAVGHNTETAAKSERSEVCFSKFMIDMHTWATICWAVYWQSARCIQQPYTDRERSAALAPLMLIMHMV